MTEAVEPVEAVPTCVWRVDAALIVRLDDAFGDPHDMYVNGSQTWLLEHGPDGAMLEWRLHPVPGYRRPAKTATEQVFEEAALALGQGAEPPTPLDQLWDGLECFPAYDDPIDPAALASAATSALGIEPTSFGAVDHQRIGDAWERTGGRVSVTELLLEQLGT